MGFPYLTALVLLPAIGALTVAFVPRRRQEVIRFLGLATTVAVASITIHLAIQFDRGDAGFQFVSSHEWISSLGISWHVGVDGISLWLVVLTGLLFPLSFIGAAVHKDVKAYTAWLLVLESAVLGTFVAQDLFLFFVFFEAVLLPMYFLIAGWGYANRAYAALKFFVFTLAGSAFLLVGIIVLVAVNARQNGGRITFNLDALAHTAGVADSRLLFLAFMVAFAVKVPIVPFHTWLPDAHTEAPTAGSVVLAGVLLKLGTYGILRYAIFLFPAAARDLSWLWLTLAVIGMTYGAIVATMQTDLKRLVAYSSVAHLGFIVLGAFAFTRQGMSGSVIQMVNHGITTPALFFLVGWISERRHTRRIADLRGLWKAAPFLGGAFLVSMLASVGVPGLNGFVGEFLILTGAFPTARWWVVVGVTGVIFAALYLLWAFQRTFKGEPDEENAAIADLNWRERGVILSLIGAMVFLGLYPKPVLDRIEPSVDRLVAEVEERSDYRQPDVLVEAGP